DDIGAQALPIRFEEVPEARAAGLFLAFEEEGHTYAVAVGQQTQSREVYHDAVLVVSGSAAEEPISLAGRDKRVCLPVFLTSGRLNIVMGVEKNRRGSFGSGNRGDDRRVAVRAVR